MLVRRRVGQEHVYGVSIRQTTTVCPLFSGKSRKSSPLINNTIGEGGQLNAFYKTINNGDKFGITIENWKGAYVLNQPSLLKLC